MLRPKDPSTILPGSAPTASFHFLVFFHGAFKAKESNDLDIRFQKVSGIEMSISNLETRRIGGRQVRLASFPSFPNLILERGYFVGESPIRDELESKFENLEICPRNVQVSLLDNESNPIASWMFYDAFPVKWAISDLDAGQSAILIETMELSYTRFQAIKL